MACLERLRLRSSSPVPSPQLRAPLEIVREHPAEGAHKLHVLNQCLEVSDVGAELEDVGAALDFVHHVLLTTVEHLKSGANEASVGRIVS